VGSEKFLGRYFHSIDDKARVAIPHKFRTSLGGENQNRVVVTLSSNPKYSYLDIYPAEEWDAILERILDMDTEGEEALEEHEALLANYVHPAQDVEIDKQGRILLPQEHRDFAGIEKEVVSLRELHPCQAKGHARVVSQIQFGTRFAPCLQNRWRHGISNRRHVHSTKPSPLQPVSDRVRYHDDSVGREAQNPRRIPIVGKPQRRNK